MARTLGGIALPDGTGQHGQVEWLDRYDLQAVAQQVRPTLGGGAVVSSRSLRVGRRITLSARERICWLTTSVVEQLAALGVTPGATYSLVWEAETHTVACRHDEPPWLSVTELFPKAGLFLAEIRLITVEV